MTDEGEILLTTEEISEVKDSDKDLEMGLFLENSLFLKEVRLWLKER